MWHFNVPIFRMTILSIITLFCIIFTGPLTSPQGLTTVGFVSTRNPQYHWPDVMLSVSALGIFKGVDKILDGAFHTGTLAQKHLSPDLGKDSHVVLVTLGLPQSRGYIRLLNKDPHKHPIINPRYYSDPQNHDIRTMVKGLQLSVKLYENTTSMQRLDAHLPRRSLPGCEHHKFNSPEYYECYIRTVTLTLYHPTSTCTMGRRHDKRAVVDSQLR